MSNDLRNPARIRACVKACEGLSTKALKAGVIGEMVDLVKELHKDDYKDDPSMGDCGEYTAWGRELAEKHKIAEPLETDEEEEEE